MRAVSLGPPPAGTRILAFSIDAALVGGATVVAYLTGGGWFALAVAVAGLPVASALFLAVAGTTPGKGAVGLRVVGADGRRPPLRAVLRRELWGRLVLEHGLMFAGGAGAVGYGAGLTGPRRPWHDVVGGTRVISRRNVATARPLAPPYAPSERLGPGGLTLAPLLPRFAAYLIDLGLIVTIWGALFVPIAIFTGQIDTSNDQQEISGAFGLSAIAAVVLIAGLYAAIGLWWRETTVGKHAVGLAVRRVDGSRISFGRALVRELVARQLLFGTAGAFIGGLPLLLDLLFPLWDDRAQSLHDKIAGTIVVRAVPRRRGRLDTASPGPDTDG
jgi:uncharacterized RDD family membrane protein YckC